MQPDLNNCARCGQPLQSMGVEKFRIGGRSGSWQLLFGSWAQLDEEVLPLEAFACSNCRSVELRVPSSD